jgi:hypothetical protein
VASIDPHQWLNSATQSSSDATLHVELRIIRRRHAPSYEPASASGVMRDRPAMARPRAMRGPIGLTFGSWP